MGRVRLCFPKRVACVARARRADHAVYADLPGERRTEPDGDHLVDQRDDIVVDVRTLEVSAASAALARDALGDGVEGDEGHGGAEVADDLFEGGERMGRARVQVRLVDFVCEEDEVVLGAETDEPLHRRLVEQRARRVARVDDHERFGLDAVRDRLGDRGLDLRRGRGPVRFLVEEVGDPDARVRR